MRRILFALLAAGILAVGVGVPYALKGPSPVAQPLLTSGPADGPHSVEELWAESLRTLQIQPPAECPGDRATGTNDAEIEAARRELLDQVRRTTATLPMPPGWQPDPNIVNIHRRICPGHDFYADGKAQGMSDDEARAYAARIQSAQQEAISSILGRPPP